MAKLTFKNAGLQSVLKLTEEGKEFNAGFNGIVSKEPKLLLVKDSGIYIMTGAGLTLPKGEKHVCCYANGYAPTDANSYEKCRAAVGGDDFVEYLDLTKELAAAIKTGGDLIINITPTHITIKVVG